MVNRSIEMTQQNETVVVGSCPKCAGPTQFIGSDKEIVEYRHVDLRRAAIKAAFEEVMLQVGAFFCDLDQKEVKYQMDDYLRELDRSVFESENARIEAEGWCDMVDELESGD
jgi:hypothetical protein